MATNDYAIGCMERCANAMPGRAATCAYVCALPTACAVGGTVVHASPVSPFQPTVCQTAGGAPRWYGWDTPEWHSAYGYRISGTSCSFVPGGGIVCSPPPGPREVHHYHHSRRRRPRSGSKGADGRP